MTAPARHPLRVIQHGGGLIAARRRFPEAPEPWLDLSTGINPVAYPVAPLPPCAFTRLPEPEAVAALEAVAARAYGLADPACVVAAPGSQSLIQRLPHLFPAAEVAVVGATYAEHAAVWRAAGSRVASWPGLARSRRGGPAVVILCNPNNPDGRRYAPAELLAAAREGVLIVDEAFADFEGVSLAHALPHPNLLLLRSFGKSYGLAGLRLGFALADPPIASAIRGALGPWAVSGPALHIGSIALADFGWREAAAARLAGDAAALDAALAGAGCTILGGTRLFRLALHPRAAHLADHLGGAGILVRRFDDHPDWLRFGVPMAADLVRLSESLASAP